MVFRAPDVLVCRAAIRHLRVHVLMLLVCFDDLCDTGVGEKVMVCVVCAGIRLRSGGLIGSCMLRSWRWYCVCDVCVCIVFVWLCVVRWDRLRSPCVLLLCGCFFLLLFCVLVVIWYRTLVVVADFPCVFCCVPVTCCLLLSVFCAFLVFLVAIDTIDARRGSFFFSVPLPLC